MASGTSQAGAPATLPRFAPPDCPLWVGSLFLRYRRRYPQDVIYQHRNFDIKGLTTQSAFTLELEHVFVDLSISPIAPHQASADMRWVHRMQLRDDDPRSIHCLASLTILSGRAGHSYRPSSRAP